MITSIWKQNYSCFINIHGFFLCTVNIIFFLSDDHFPRKVAFDHDFFSISIHGHFQYICHLSYICYLVGPSNIFLRCFPCCIFLWSFQSTQDVPVSLFLSHGQKRLPEFYIFSFWLILFRLISLQSMRL